MIWRDRTWRLPGTRVPGSRAWCVLGTRGSRYRASMPMHIGLLMTYNEIDVIAETLAANRGAVDTIFALDGSDDGTTEVLAADPQVELLLRDEDVAPGERVRDHHRQALLDAAHARYGHGHWFTLLHGDEIFHDDARAVAQRAEREGARRVNWAAMQFFLHPDDEGTLDLDASVQERVRWYSPFWVEVRQFRSGPRTRYRERHGVVVPDGVGWRPFSRMPVLKHYPFRSPEQTAARLEAMRSRGFSGTATAGAPGSVEGSVYRPRYGDAYRRALRFEGDFGPCELDRQGGLVHMVWRWKRWVRQR